MEEGVERDKGGKKQGARVHVRRETRARQNIYIQHVHNTQSMK